MPAGDRRKRRQDGLCLEFSSRRLLYKLPGHSGSVNEAVFHPQEPIVASAGSDKQIYVGELAL